MKEYSEINKSNKETIKNLNLDRILLPLDGSIESETSIPYASMLSRWFNGEIMLLHVLPENPIAAVERTGNVSYPDAQHDRGEILAKSYLEAIIDAIAPQGIKARWGISTGTEYEMIISRSNSSHIGILAISTKIKSRIKRFFTNNLLDQILSKTNIPLLVVNSNNLNLETMKPSSPNVIITTINKNISHENINRIISILIGSKATLLFINKKQKFINKNKENILNPKLLDLIRQNNINYEITNTENNVSSKINSIQNSDDNHWVLTISNNKKGLNGINQNNFAYEILKKSKFPVIILPE